MFRNNFRQNILNYNKFLSRRYSRTPPQSLGQRFKQLSQKYGWVAVGVYGAISVLDFSIAFTAVNVIGADKVKLLEDKLLSCFGINTDKDSEKDENTKEERNSLWAMAVLAYGIHKTLFLPPRLALAAGVTPRLVRELQRRGYAIGPNSEKVVARMRQVKDRINRDK
ncbi:hypothetical protein WALSEDRAFT_60780 [Wallemia mellicola CBS 633.66]|uniref:DUF1279 domain-containing protein n=1 Tax=Wallemia mellicola (strain ATCC MYA-4683 / CBS 633.66) TaxID=671144 RepID=I4Y9K8_WALMC|nr:hypothetical protein WALSEDRAFT_60780 [Wallemia mellicola CBS 633.66]EIM20650.1 hypothetical protein WALSEDRAFT_60780 [Wallemia mellicola CBS 633.66]|eukprot:XP_006959185.1 hypothetical protein WALSEDRAFT_60780 [Wallemia mellicola CBS 633.66]